MSWVQDPEIESKQVIMSLFYEKYLSGRDTTGEEYINWGPVVKDALRGLYTDEDPFGPFGLRGVRSEERALEVMKVQGSHVGQIPVIAYTTAEKGAPTGDMFVVTGTCCYGPMTLRHWQAKNVLFFNHATIKATLEKLFHGQIVTNLSEVGIYIPVCNTMWARYASGPCADEFTRFNVVE